MKHWCIVICMVYLMLGCTHQPQKSTVSTTASHPESEKPQEPVVVTPVPEEQTAETVHKLDEFLELTPVEDLHSLEKEQIPVPRGSHVQDSFNPGQVEALSAPTPVALQAQVLPSIDAPQTRENAPKGIGLNFDNADIYDVTRVVSEITGKSFIVDKSVQGTVTIFSESTLTPDEVFDLFKTVLELNGLAIKQVGDFYKIVPAEPKRYLQEDSGTLLTQEDQIVTRIVKLKHVRAEDVKNAIQSLMPSDKEIVVYPDAAKGDTLIITDIASNMAKILDLIKEIDVSKYDNQYFQIFPIEYADLSELIHDLNQILSLQEDAFAEPTVQPAQPADGQQDQFPSTTIVSPGTRTRIHPITRLNALVVSTNNPEVITLVRKWIDILDQPQIQGFAATASPNERINHVYVVQYAKAEELAPLLAQVYDEVIEPAQPPTDQDQDQQQQPSAQAPTTEETGPPPEFIFDAKSNSIIIRSTETQYADIKKLLEKLDQRPLQVLIDVIIAEVTLDDSEILGVRGMLVSQDQVTIGNETNSVNSTAETVFNNVLPEGAEGFTYAVTAPGRFLAKLRALATENKVKILSDPHILVRNNQEAVMNVGSRIPIKETTGTGDDVKQTIKYENVGIILTVTPQINFDGDVVMEIKQEVSDVGQEQFGDTGAASFTKREATTSVITQDGHPIVIGGLIQNRDENNVTGVPLLKDVPLLGRLFRHTEKKNRRQDLFILVTPRVIRTPGQGWIVTDNVLEQRVKELEKLFNREETASDKVKEFLRNRITP
ncbi:GspD2 protein [Candidatus Vecturithrix granuli]|uniref:GspD2 protein n=1 Tax=Vecturithrix granuli TaxID=1499967 RepID=A0A081BZD2_VECG1|nr:GspD2 protein [Candidatus Vecturithrix granuli]